MPAFAAGRSRREREGEGEREGEEEREARVGRGRHGKGGEGCLRDEARGYCPWVLPTRSRPRAPCFVLCKTVRVSEMGLDAGEGIADRRGGRHRASGVAAGLRQEERPGGLAAWAPALRGATKLDLVCTDKTHGRRARDEAPHDSRGRGLLRRQTRGAASRVHRSRNKQQATAISRRMPDYRPMRGRGIAGSGPPRTSRLGDLSGVVGIRHSRGCGCVGGGCIPKPEPSRCWAAVWLRYAGDTGVEGLQKCLSPSPLSIGRGRSEAVDARACAQAPGAIRLDPVCAAMCDCVCVRVRACARARGV